MQKPKIIIRLGIASNYLSWLPLSTLCAALLIVSVEFLQTHISISIYGHRCTILFRRCTASINHKEYFSIPVSPLSFNRRRREFWQSLLIFNFNFDCFVSKEVKKKAEKFDLGSKTAFHPMTIFFGCTS